VQIPEGPQRPPRNALCRYSPTNSSEDPNF
jgi:hypothetical protein